MAGSTATATVMQTAMAHSTASPHLRRTISPRALKAGQSELCWRFSVRGGLLQTPSRALVAQSSSRCQSGFSERSTRSLLSLGGLLGASGHS